MKRRINEWLSVQLAQNPARIVLSVILLFNILFLLVSAIVISNLSLTGTEDMGILEAAFYTITMILDAGCIQFVVADIGQSGVAAAVVCLVIILVGMISFTGAVIGYITNYISNFIEHSNTGTKKLRISDHVVILNWNTRASEIINDLLYCDTKQKVVVLAEGRKVEIEREIEERLSDTVARENDAIREKYCRFSLIKRRFLIAKNRFKRNVTVIVREGDVFSSKQLRDISLEYARIVVILGNDRNNSVCKYEYREKEEQYGKGNSLTIKTLMQVADITGASYSYDNQKIIVEITDDWTWRLVSRIIKSKQVEGKCNIVPVPVNQILGQILSQFSLMPDLNLAYKELFSNKGATFYTEKMPKRDETEYISEYFQKHRHAIPLSFLDSSGVSYFYYSAVSEKDIHRESPQRISDYTVKLNYDYWLEQKNVIILGHNGNCKEIMMGFSAFCAEWNYKNQSDEILRIIVIDEQKNLEKMEYYKEYPFVVETVAADIYDKDLICDTIERFVSMNEEDTSVLILSDDTALNEDIDANALANLVYVQEIIDRKKEENPDFDEESIDVIVEIIDPKHHDIVSNYSVNNVVISNRFISKMITQIGEKEALFDFYTDILTYDQDTSNGYESKEIYAKKVGRFFAEIPKPCMADELIRAVYFASIDPSLPKEKQNPTIVLGYVKKGGNMVLFEQDLSSVEVRLEENDKLIVFSTH